MFQDPYASLDPRMRVKEIIFEPLDIARRGSRRERVETVRRLLDEVGLAHDAIDRYPHEFSGGQRQRLGLARALALKPEADRRRRARLDVSIRSQILNLMKRLQGSHDLTYIVISHDLSVVRYLADRIGVMYLGKLVEVGVANHIYDKPAHPYTAGLLKRYPCRTQSWHGANNTAWPSAGSCPRRSTRPRVAASAPAALERRTYAPKSSHRCAPSGNQHLAACHFPLHVSVASR